MFQDSEVHRKDKEKSTSWCGIMGPQDREVEVRRWMEQCSKVNIYYFIQPIMKVLSDEQHLNAMRKKQKQISKQTKPK